MTRIGGQFRCLESLVNRNIGRNDFSRLAWSGENLAPDGPRTASAHKLPRVSNFASNGAGRHRHRGSQKDLRFPMAHAPGEIPIGRADAFHRRVHAAERVGRPAQASRTTGVFSHLHAGLDQDLPDRLVAPTRRLQVANDFRRRGHAKRVDGDTSAADDAGEIQKIARFAARAGADVGAVEFDMIEFLRRRALTGIGMAGYQRFEFGQIDDQLVNELLLTVALDRFISRLRPIQFAPIIHVRLGLGIELKNAILAASFNGHVRDGHAVVHAQMRRGGPIKLHRAIGRAVKTDLADAVENDILGHEAWLQLAFEAKMHRFRHFQKQFACAHHKACIGVANARGELVERAGHAGVRVGAKQNFARTRVAFLWQRRVTDTREVRPVLPLELALRRVKYPVAIRVVDYVVKIFDLLLLHELAQDIDVAVRLRIGGENVVVGNDDDFVPVPHLGVLAELAPEHANRPRPAHIVCHQDVGFHPNVVARLDLSFACRTGQDFFGQRHKHRSA